MGRGAERIKLNKERILKEAAKFLIIRGKTKEEDVPLVISSYNSSLT